MRTSELRHRAETLSRRESDLGALCRAFDRLVRPVTGHVAAAWSTHDPATGLITSCTMVGLPKDPGREAELFRNEFVDGEPATYRELIADGRTTAVLSDVTDGDLSAASRYRNLLAGFGVTDELRAILRSAGTTWGSATLYRTDGTFSEDQRRQVEVVAPLAGDGVRLALLRAAASRPAALDEPPGILSVDGDGRVRPVTEPAHDWLAVGGGDLETTAIATAAAMRSQADWRGATARLRVGGDVLALHAAHVDGRDGTVAVIVERARPAAVASMLVDAYGLTPRQRDVLGLLLLGRPMTGIARELGISEHTANDHRKAIYRRIGVASRSELAAVLQTEHYDPRAHRGVPPSPYGGFLE